MIEKIELRDGYYAEIHHDSDVEQPHADDEGVHIVVLHGKYMDPSKGACGKTPDEVAKWEKKNAKSWYTVPLWLYDHSGTAYAVGATNPFSCPWDSGRVGTIALKRSEWGNGKENDEELFKRAQSIAETYSMWANGETYSYNICDENEETIDSCGGFIGLDVIKAEIELQAENLLSGPRQSM